MIKDHLSACDIHPFTISKHKRSVFVAHISSVCAISFSILNEIVEEKIWSKCA
jgi:hypothetical protein